MHAVSSSLLDDNSFLVVRVHRDHDQGEEDDDDDDDVGQVEPIGFGGRRLFCIEFQSVVADFSLLACEELIFRYVNLALKHPADLDLVRYGTFE